MGNSQKWSRSLTSCLRSRERSLTGRLRSLTRVVARRALTVITKKKKKKVTSANVIGPDFMKSTR